MELDERTEDVEKEVEDMERDASEVEEKLEKIEGEIEAIKAAIARLESNEDSKSADALEAELAKKENEKEGELRKARELKDELGRKMDELEDIEKSNEISRAELNDLQAEGIINVSEAMKIVNERDERVETLRGVILELLKRVDGFS